MLRCPFSYNNKEKLYLGYKILKDQYMLKLHYKDIKWLNALIVLLRKLILDF